MCCLIFSAVIGLAGCGSSSGSNSNTTPPPPATDTELEPELEPETDTQPEQETAPDLETSPDSDAEPETEAEPQFQNYGVRLDGTQQVPMVDTVHFAMAQVTVIETNNETNRQVTAEIDLKDVPGVTIAQIRSGQVGADGPMLFAFTDENGDGLWEIKEKAVSQAQHDALLAGNWYLTVRTDKFPKGELRGQVLSAAQSVHVFTLSGDQAVPRVQTSAYGQGYLFYDGSNGVLTLNTHAWNLTPTAVHIYMAGAGLNGEVVAGWEVSPDDENVWHLADGNTLGKDEILALHMANLYVNIHTEAHPGGELRGQILPEDYALLLFDLSPDQEVPRVDSMASGTGYATINTRTGGLRLNVWSMGMDTKAVHIHEAGIGENGYALIALDENMDHAGLWQIPENIGMNADTQALLLSGGHYVNMHSNEFPAGEIRGQIIAAPWSIIAFALAGTQEVPPVETEAEGDGYALINAESGELMMVVNTRNLDAASAAHIHTGIVGVNGDVLAHLEQEGTDISVWRLPPETQLDEVTLTALLNGGHYVSVQTPSHPEGEVRGQIAQ